MVIDIARLGSTPEGSFGVLSINGYPFCVTLERPYLNNKVNVSAIPIGVYTCSRFSSESHPYTWRVDNVDGRSGILFHAGNTIHDIQGCILLAERYGRLDGNRAVLNSRDAIGRFMDVTSKEKELTLIVRSV